MNTKIHYTLMAGLLLGGCNLSDDQINDEFDELEIFDPANGPTSPLPGLPDELAGTNEATPYNGVPMIPQECVGAPIVGILTNPAASCKLRDTPQDWVWRPMFEDGSPEVAALSLPVPQELERYCMYEYVGVMELKEIGEYAQILQAIDAHPDMELGSVAADCMGFKEQGDLNDSGIRKVLKESFAINIDAIEGSDLQATESYQQPVWLAVIDSVSQVAVDNQIAPHNEHGLYMSSLIGDIACPDAEPDCLAQIRHLLAMPRSDYQLPDWTVGEDYASKVDVAIQVYAAVQQWREAKINQDPDAADRLVLNISLGYNRLNAGADDFNRGPQASLKTALQFASCHGALVFAASGNVRDENCPDNDVGPLAPASFEAIPAPSEAECHALGFDPDWQLDFPVFPPVNHGPTPLVHAVGGVDAYDQFLVNGRKDSRPKLAALGANGIGSDMSMALTGSSVSSAVASATAMLLWMYNPRLRPDEVYEAIYDSGWNLGEPADFGVDGPGKDIHRISVCAALDRVCSNQDPNECPQFGCAAGPPAADGNLGGFFAEVDVVLADPATVIEDCESTPSAPICDPTPLTELVTPQPEVPICGHCKSDIAGGATADDDVLYMSIASAYKGSITAGVLIIEDAGGMSTAITFSNKVITALNNVNVNVTKVLFEGPGTVAATINFTLANGETQSNPVIVRSL
jgi:hypothetical protein